MKDLWGLQSKSLSKNGAEKDLWRKVENAIVKIQGRSVVDL